MPQQQLHAPPLTARIHELNARVLAMEARMAQVSAALGAAR